VGSWMGCRAGGKETGMDTGVGGVRSIAVSEGWVVPLLCKLPSPLCPE
jgi:hypothetical protein